MPGVSGRSVRSALALVCRSAAREPSWTQLVRCNGSPLSKTDEAGPDELAGHRSGGGAGGVAQAQLVPAHAGELGVQPAGPFVQARRQHAACERDARYGYRYRGDKGRHVARFSRYSRWRPASS